MLDNLYCLHISGYVCHCGPSWEGKQCEILVKKCAAYPCNNGAKCTDVGEDYFCTCAAGELGQGVFSLVTVTGTYEILFLA